MQKIKLSNTPLSRKLFEESYDRFTEKVGTKKDTIFEDTKQILKVDEDIVYDLFTKSDLFEDLMENTFTSTNYEKKKIINTFLEESYLPVLFNNIISNIDESKLGFKQQMIIENTMEQFTNLENFTELEKLCESITSDNYDILEEGFMYQFSRISKSLPSLGTFLAHVSTTFIAFIAMMIGFRSHRETFAKSHLGIIKGTLMSVTDLFGLNVASNSFEHSRKAIFDFDRIDSNPEVKKLFQKLLQTESSYKQAPVLLDNVFTQCLENHHLMFDNVELSQDEKDELKNGNKYNPKDVNTLVSVSREILKQAIGKNNTSKSAILSFRKCLAGSLTDIYKYLMIGVFTNDESRQKVAGLLTKNVFSSNPETLVRFMKAEHATDDMNKRAGILVQLRLTYDDLIDNLDKGSTNIDREAAKFFRQKLDEADKEISDYLLKTKGNRSSDDDNKYNSDEDENKNFNPTNKKRSILGMGN